MLTLDCSLAQAWTERLSCWPEKVQQVHKCLPDASGFVSCACSYYSSGSQLELRVEFTLHCKIRLSSLIKANNKLRPRPRQQRMGERESERGAGTESRQCQAYKAAQLLPLVYTQCGLLIEFEQCNALRKSLEALVWASNEMKIEKKN